MRTRIVDAAVASIPVAKETALAHRLWKARHPLLKLIEGGVANKLVEELGARAGSAEEIAGVLAHEMQHVESRHGLRGMAAFFDTLNKDQGALPEALSLLSTHPASSERSARLRQLMGDAPDLPPLACDWARLRASLKQAESPTAANGSRYSYSTRLRPPALAR